MSTSLDPGGAGGGGEHTAYCQPKMHNQVHKHTSMLPLPLPHTGARTHTRTHACTHTRACTHVSTHARTYTHASMHTHNLPLHSGTHNGVSLIHMDLLTALLLCLQRPPGPLYALGPNTHTCHASCPTHTPATPPALHTRLLPYIYPCRASCPTHTPAAPPALHTPLPRLLPYTHPCHASCPTHTPAAPPALHIPLPRLLSYTHSCSRLCPCPPPPGPAPYLENRLRMRPAGWVSKNDLGRRRMWSNRALWMATVQRTHMKRKWSDLRGQGTAGLRVAVVAGGIRYMTGS